VPALLAHGQAVRAVVSRGDVRASRVTVAAIELLGCQGCTAVRASARDTRPAAPRLAMGWDTLGKTTQISQARYHKHSKSTQISYCSHGKKAKPERAESLKKKNQALPQSLHARHRPNFFYATGILLGIAAIASSGAPKS